MAIPSDSAGQSTPDSGSDAGKVHRARAVALGVESTCALMVDGTVRCWGDTFEWARLATNPPPNPLVPTAIPRITDAVNISVGGEHSCAVVSSGAVWCWGFNSVAHVFIGNYRSRNPKQVAGLTNAREVVVGSNDTTCVLRSDGVVSCWGLDADPDHFGSRVDELHDIAGLSGVRHLGGGAETMCVVMEDGSVRCWGEPHDGVDRFPKRPRYVKPNLDSRGFTCPERLRRALRT